MHDRHEDGFDDLTEALLSSPADYLAALRPVQRTAHPLVENYRLARYGRPARPPLDRNHPRPPRPPRG